MTRRPALLTALLALVVLPLAVTVTVACRGDRPDWRIVQLYGGQGSVHAIQEPTRVEAFRIDPMISSASAGLERVGLHKVTAGPVAVDAAGAAELADIFLAPSTYDWHSAKSCEFLPGVGLRFTRDVSRVDVALCFECDMLTIHRHGKRIGVEDFDDERPRLVALMKRLFPDDAEIQGLAP